MKNSKKLGFAVLILSLLCFSGGSLAETYLLNGGQEADINYMMVQEVTPHPGIKTLTLRFAVPASFDSPTYRQTISDAQYYFHPQPASQRRVTDERGNEFLEAVWDAPAETVRSTVRFQAKTAVTLSTLSTAAPFPVKDLPEEALAYLGSTKLAESDDPAVAEKARALTARARTEYDAVQRILSWLVDHMKYESRPVRKDASYALETGRGNCQNYAHLAAGLMRSVGIPVRVVTGVTLKWPYQVRAKNAVITLNMAMGRHAWIEVFFPDLGWVPFNPQNSVLFVSNRFIRLESGRDNSEASQDGLIQWTQPKGVTGAPRPSEIFHADFLDDHVEVAAAKAGYGPRALVLVPNVEGSFTRVKAAAAAAAGPPPGGTRVVPPASAFTMPLSFGNLDFPENLDFSTFQGEPVTAPDGTMSFTRSFLVETAEYVTTKGEQYAQAFVADKPVKLSEVALALHSFGSDGQIWAELYGDKDGAPAGLIATSEIKDLSGAPYKPGYTWEGFRFEGKPILPAGQYWVALGFTGSPIVNWFYTYGRPVGPENGTRMKTMFEPEWNHVLANEFNYRVTGETVE